jgi:hypothetical protein
MDAVDVKIVLNALEKILNSVKTIQEIMQIEIAKFKNADGEDEK